MVRWGSPRLVVALVVLGLASVLGWGLMRDLRAAQFLEGVHEVPLNPPRQPALGAVNVGRGAHLVRHVLACTACHGDDLGGAVLEDERFGRIVGPNLTGGQGSAVAGYTVVDWDRAIRHGLSRDGRILVRMPTAGYAFLGQRELLEVLAYLAVLPPIDRDLGATELSAVGRQVAFSGALGAGFRDIDHAAVGRVEPPAPAADPAYGRHLAQIAGCHGCHGVRLEGEQVRDGQATRSDLTPAPVHGWERLDFVKAVKGGQGKGGRRLSAVMPYAQFRGMSDDEIAALWAYLAPDAD